jgi:hypothetical protein
VARGRPEVGGAAVTNGRVGKPRRRAGSLGVGGIRSSKAKRLPKAASVRWRVGGDAPRPRNQLPPPSRSPCPAVPVSPIGWSTTPSLPPAHGRSRRPFRHQRTALPYYLQRIRIIRSSSCTSFRCSPNISVLRPWLSIPHQQS